MFLTVFNYLEFKRLYFMFLKGMEKNLISFDIILKKIIIWSFKAKTNFIVDFLSMI